MKKLICYIAIFVLILCCLSISISATDTATTSDIIESDTEISDAFHETNTLEKTETEALESTETENAVNNDISQIETEDKDTWALIKKEFGADPQFWAVLIMCAIMIVVTVFVCFVQLAKTNPTTRKSMNGMSKAINVVQGIKEENSQTLKKIVEDNQFWREKVIELESKLSSIETLDVKEKHDLFLALFYDLRIHKLVCDRLNMPINDKSAIDLWYSKGIEAIKNDISKDDLDFVDRISSMLDGIGKKK